LRAEEFASIASLYGQPYPQEELNRAWRRLLFNHFHDIMPGSGIAVNYLDAKRELEDVQCTANNITMTSANEIAARINTQSVTGAPVVVLHPLSWKRNEVVEVDVQFPGPPPAVTVVDAAGRTVSSHLLSIDKETHRARLLVQVSVPSLGYATY